MPPRDEHLHATAEGVCRDPNRVWFGWDFPAVSTAASIRSRLVAGFPLQSNTVNGMTEVQPQCRPRTAHETDGEAAEPVGAFVMLTQVVFQGKR
jgi:hypothetical protein